MTEEIMQSEAVKDMPETIELGYFYIGAPMSEYFYSVMDDETRLQGMQPLRKAVYVRQEAAQSPASAVEVVTVADFDEWMTDRWNEYSRAGWDDENAPNYEPHKAIEQFIEDYQERFPKGLKIKPESE